MEKRKVVAMLSSAQIAEALIQYAGQLGLLEPGPLYGYRVHSENGNVDRAEIFEAPNTNKGD